MNIIREFKLKPGDKLIVPKSTINIIQHHVIYLGVNYNGVQLIAENVAGMYVRLIAANDFFLENSKLNSIVRFEGSNEDRQMAIKRALNQLGKPYDLINFNCEHFANYVQNGEVKSLQVQWGIFFISICIILLLD